MKEKAFCEKLGLSHVLEEHRERLIRILAEFHDIKDVYRRDISITFHGINIEPGSQPVTQCTGRIGARDADFVAEDVNFILKSKIIEPATFEYTCLIVIVPKHDRSYSIYT